MRQIPMDRFRLASPLRYGCVAVAELESVPLLEAVFTNDKGKLGLTLWGNEPPPWHGSSLVSIQMFRLPEMQGEFHKELEWFAANKKHRARLPDGRGVSPQDLAPANADGDWEHEFFATSGRDIFHVYRSPSIALFVRFLGPSGTMLDHPVLARVASRLTIDAAQWIETIPTPEVVEGTGRLKECAPDESRLSALRQARPEGSAQLLAEWVHDNIATGDANVLAVAWGDALCRATDWEWVVVEDALVLSPPERTHIVDPFDLIQTGRKHPKKDTSLLVFNMILAEILPPEPPYSYACLGGS